LEAVPPRFYATVQKFGGRSCRAKAATLWRLSVSLYYFTCRTTTT
jgi:hypothetical protein